MTTISAVAPLTRAVDAIAKKKRDLGETRGGRVLRRTLISSAILISMGVAGVGGWRSYTAVSTYFGSWTVPAIADGVIVAATVLRLAALTYAWRMPGSVMITILGLGGTVYLNIAASKGNGAAQFSHALAPIAYLILIEMLAHLLKLKLELAVQAEARLTFVGWLVSPVVTTRSWLLMQRQGLSDPVAARTLVQQSIRARSQLLIICPSRWWSPLGAARRARGAALQAVRDGLLTAAEVVKLLPDGVSKMPPVKLLIAVNHAALLPRVPAEVELAQALEAAQFEMIRIREEASAELAQVLEAEQAKATRIREEGEAELSRAREQTAGEATARYAEAGAELQREREQHRAAFAEMAAAAETERETLRSQFLGEIESLRNELAAALAAKPEPDPEPGGGLNGQDAGAPQGGRRPVATGEPDKKKNAQLKAALMRKLTADLESGQRSDLLSENAEVRNSVMYPLADAIPLNRGSARTYLSSLLPELQKVARSYRPGLTLLVPGTADDDEEPVEQSAAG